MTNYVRWSDIRADHVDRAGGERALEDGKQELLATVVGRRLRRGAPPPRSNPRLEAGPAMTDGFRANEGPRGRVRSW